jgi:hypothetical protein
MYSRSERNFSLVQNKDQNPSVGPGTYVPEPKKIVNPMIKKKAIPSPFNSCTPRSSAFDEMVNFSPSPNSYEPLPNRNKGTKTSVFGRSKVHFQFNF